MPVILEKVVLGILLLFFGSVTVTNPWGLNSVQRVLSALALFFTMTFVAYTINKNKPESKPATTTSILTDPPAIVPPTTAKKEPSSGAAIQMYGKSKLKMDDPVFVGYPQVLDQRDESSADIKGMRATKEDRTNYPAVAAQLKVFLGEIDHLKDGEIESWNKKVANYLRENWDEWYAEQFLAQKNKNGNSKPMSKSQLLVRATLRPHRAAVDYTAKLARSLEPFDDPAWLFELKHDGFRSLAYLEDGHCRLVSRRRNTYKSFEVLRSALAQSARFGPPLDWRIDRMRSASHFREAPEEASRVL